MKRLICRWRGHRIHPDPGDFVLYCTRCHAMADIEDFRAWGVGGMTTPEPSHDLRRCDCSFPRPPVEPVTLSDGSVVVYLCTGCLEVRFMPPQPPKGCGGGSAARTEPAEVAKQRDELGEGLTRAMQRAKEAEAERDKLQIRLDDSLHLRREQTLMLVEKEKALADAERLGAVSALRAAADERHFCTKIDNGFGGYECNCGENWSYPMRPMGCIERQWLHDRADRIEGETR